MTTYTLHSQGSYGLVASGNGTVYTFGVEFAVSKTLGLTGIWFYSGAGAASLPTACALYNANTQAQISGSLNSSPTWSGAAGSGWVKCSYNSTVLLQSGTKYVAVIQSPASGGDYYQASGYWSTGAGASGIANGPLSAPGSSASVNGQMTYGTSGSLAFPTNTVTGFDFGVDVEVSDIYIVQTANNSGSAASTLTVTLGNPTGAGNCLLVATESSDTSTNPHVTGMTLGGSAGNFAALVPPVGTTVTSAGIVDIWADPGCAGGQTAVVVTWSAGGAHEQFATVYEVAGLATSSILDTSATGFTTVTNPTWASGNTATTAQANEFWFGANGAYQTTITGPSSPWFNTVLTGPSRDFISGYQIPTSTGVAGYSGSYAPNSYSEAAVVTLKGAASGNGTYAGQVANVAVAAPMGTATGSSTVTVSTTAIANVVNGVAVRRWLSASGGTAPYTWLVTSGSLPAGLAVASDGTLSGTPTGTGTSTFTVQATDTNSNAGTATFSITSVSAPFSPSSPTTDGNGVITWSITSAINLADSESIRVLNPPSPSGYPHGFVITLPVAAGTDEQTFGNGLDTIRTGGFHNTYNLTVIEPSTGADWMADSPATATLLQETYLLQVVAWAKATYGTTGTEKIYLMGFSRTGIAGQGLFFHHPDVYYAVASWDFPATMTGFDGTDPNGGVGGSPANSYGTQDSFAANYELSPANLTKWAAGQNFGSVLRVWIGGYQAFQADVTQYDPILTTAGILHSTSLVSESSHNWAPTPGWVGPALAALVPAPASSYAGQVANVTVAAPVGWANVSTPGAVAHVTVAAPAGTVTTGVGTLVSASMKSSFRARKSISVQATMEFEAGQPVQTSLTTLASDPWISMYPG